MALLDEWAARFFEGEWRLQGCISRTLGPHGHSPLPLMCTELDYVREGQNATRFAETMRVELPQVNGRAGGGAVLGQVAAALVLPHKGLCLPGCSRVVA